MGQGLGGTGVWDSEAGALARARIIELRRDHVEFVEIGRQLWEAGMWPSDPHRINQPPARQSVWQQWRRALKLIPAPALAEFRMEMLELLQEQYRRAQEVLDAYHVAHSNGQVVMLGNPPQPVTDDGPKLAAIREQRMLVAQMSVLMGGNAPTQQKLTLDASVEYTVVGVDVEALK